MPFITNPPRYPALIPPVLTFPSMYESFAPLTNLNRQKFVEWFSGAILDAIWTQTNTVGTNIFAMSDTIDGGFRITTETGATANGAITFNAKKHYSPTSSVILSIPRREDPTMSVFAGFSINPNPAVEHAFVNNDTNQTNYILVTGDASTSTSTIGDIPIDTISHLLKIELKASSAEWSIDGVAQTDKSTNLPTVGLQPFFLVKNRASGAHTGLIRYLEAYNT